MNPAYGAAEGMDHEAQRYIAKGASLRRTRTAWLIASIAAVAAVGCIAVVLQGRTTELWAMGGGLVPGAVPTNPTIYNIYSPSDVAKERAALEHDKAVQAAREAAYAAAIRNAQVTQGHMADLIRYYSGIPPNPADYRDIQAASIAWKRRKHALEVLEQEISREQGALEQMHTAEAALRDRHDQLAAEIARLVDQAEETESQMSSLKGRYSQEVHDLRLQDKATQDNLREEKYALQRELSANDKAQAAVHAEMASAMSKAAYYNEQASHAQEDVEGIRTRSKASEQEAADSNKEAATAESLAVDQEVQSAESIANQRVAKVEAKTATDVSHIEQQAAIAVDKKRAKAIKLEAEARVQKALDAAAKKAEEAAEAEEEDVADSVKKVKEEIQAVTDKIYEARGKAGDARVEAVEFTGKENMAKTTYDRIEDDLRLTRRKIAAANNLLETAEAKKAMLETQTKIDELLSAAAQSMATAKGEEAEKAAADSEAAVGAESAQAEELQGKLEGLFQEALAAKAEALGAAAEAKLTHGRAGLQDSVSQQIVHAALDRRRKAEALLKSVDELTRLARHAAHMAEYERIKAEAEEHAPQTQGAWIGPFPAPCGLPPCPAPAAESPLPPSSPAHDGAAPAAAADAAPAEEGDGAADGAAPADDSAGR